MAQTKSRNQLQSLLRASGRQLGESGVRLPHFRFIVNSRKKTKKKAKKECGLHRTGSGIGDTFEFIEIGSAADTLLWFGQGPAFSLSLFSLSLSLSLLLL